MHAPGPTDLGVLCCMDGLDAIKNGTRSASTGRSRRLATGRLRRWAIPISLAAGVAVWHLVALWSGLPRIFLPSPADVWGRLILGLTDGSLLRHTWVTLYEVLAGLALGMSVASLLGYVLARSPTAERFLAPYIVASQSIPVVAIAPLLVIWFGPGTLSKVLISALIVFFPILVNTVVGLRSVPQDLRDLMRSLRATRRQMFLKLEMPAALPVIFGGLKVGATLSVVGAVVGEFVGADRGLGFLINVGRGLYDTTLVFVSVFLLIGMAVTLYAIVAYFESHLLRWRKSH
jgi:NitT/TauT family transport system permease protein